MTVALPVLRLGRERRLTYVEVAVNLRQTYPLFTDDAARDAWGGPALRMERH